VGRSGHGSCLIKFSTLPVLACSLLVCSSPTEDAHRVTSEQGGYALGGLLTRSRDKEHSNLAIKAGTQSPDPRVFTTPA